MLDTSASFALHNADEALRALRAAVDRYTSDQSDLEPVRRFVLQYSDHARRESIAPEQMLIRLKHALDGAMPLLGDDLTAREETRTSIIGLAITAYYADADSSSSTHM